MERRKYGWHITGFILAGGCLATVGYLLPRRPVQVSKPDLEVLARRSLATEGECESFFTETRGLMPQGPLKVLEKMEAYPGIPRPTREAWRRLASELGTEGDTDVSRAIALPHCRFDEAVSIYLNLVRASGKYTLEERSTLTRASLRFLDVSTSAPLSLESLLQGITLMREMRRYQLLKGEDKALDKLYEYARGLSARIDGRWKELQGRVFQAKTFGEISESDRKLLASHLKYSFSQAERIRVDYHPLVAHALKQQ